MRLVGLVLDRISTDQPNGDLSKAAWVAGLVVAGTSTVALVIAWATFLLWLAAEVVMSVVHRL